MMKLDQFKVETIPLEPLQKNFRLFSIAESIPDIFLDVKKLDGPIVAYSDGKEKICREVICRNKELGGGQHPITGVPFERKEIEVKGEVVEGVFPQFESTHDVELPKDLYEAKNKEQFDYANGELRKAVDSDPELRTKFSGEQLEQIRNGDRPDGFVWHHSENPGQLQLVDKNTHDLTGHTGGQVIWGGGQVNR